MVSSAAYPSLERKPGGPDNWIEEVGGLPKYIERIAKHLHYEEGMTISHAIATAVNTVKRWARRGTVVKYNDPKNNIVTTITAAQAAATVAEWEAKKAKYRASARSGRSGRLRSKLLDLAEAEVSIQQLAERANAVTDPAQRTKARMAVMDLAMTKDGRKSYKRQGKWGHGFVPLDAKAKESKAKGSPIAAKRVNRLFGSPSKANSASRAAVKKTLEQRAKRGAAHGSKIRANTGKKGGGQTERVQDVGQSIHADVRDAKASHRAKVAVRRESSIKGKRRAPARATQPWDQIPESQKTIRGGTRYVMSTFNGQNLLTEWVGKNQKVEAPGEEKRQYSRVREQDLQKLTTGQLRKLLKSKKQSKDAQKVISRALRKRVAADKEKS